MALRAYQGRCPTCGYDHAFDRFFVGLQAADARHQEILDQCFRMAVKYTPQNCLRALAAEFEAIREEFLRL